jgi:hypothetical protein
MKAIKYYPYDTTSEVLKVDRNPNVTCFHDWRDRVGRHKFDLVCVNCGAFAKLNMETGAIEPEPLTELSVTFGENTKPEVIQKFMESLEKEVIAAGGKIHGQVITSNSKKVKASWH